MVNREKNWGGWKYKKKKSYLDELKSIFDSFLGAIIW